jgi:hypothetical protein
VPVAPQAVLPKPGWLASGTEKSYYQGVLAYLGANYEAATSAFEAAIASDPQLPSAHFLAAMAGGKAGRPDAECVAHLEAVVASDVVMPDRLQAKYMPAHTVGIALTASITEHITASLPFNAVGASLLLAEAYQEDGRLSDAIGLVAQLHETYPDDPVIALSLADLLFADADYDGVLAATQGATNTADIGVGLLHMRAAALFAHGHENSAFEAFKLALAKTADRDVGLLKVIRYDRALAYESVGQRAKAKADLESFMAKTQDSKTCGPDSPRWAESRGALPGHTHARSGGRSGVSTVADVDEMYARPTMPASPVGEGAFQAVVLRVIAALDEVGWSVEAARLDDLMAPFRSPWTGGDPDDAKRDLRAALADILDRPDLDPAIAEDVRYALRPGGVFSPQEKDRRANRETRGAKGHG